MNIEIEEEFKMICDQIVAEGRGEAEWAEMESDDMFQSHHYCGGFDATEGAFCFSYFSSDLNEFWFQCNLEEITKISSGEKTKVDLRSAEA